MRVRFRDWILILVASGALSAGCIAPTVAVVDQKTALEQQAAGGYPTLENELDQAGLEPAPEPFAREELASGRERAGIAALGDLAELYVRVASDADALEALLLQHCIGEASNGLLVARPSDCIGATDAIELTRLIGRANLHRRQVWQLLAADGTAPLDRVQTAWSRLHREQVVCGGLIERAEGAWEPKSC